MKALQILFASASILLMPFQTKIHAQQIISTFEPDTENYISTIEGASKYQEATPIAVDNPYKTGLNKSNKVLYVKTKRGILMDWWENAVTLTLDQPIEITDENRYLHILHYRTNPLDYWVIHTYTNQFLNLGQGTCVANRWVDLVVDLKSAQDPEGEVVNALSNIRLELNGNWTTKLYTPTEFYYDDILLSNSSAPRSTGEVTTPAYVSGFEETDYIPPFVMAGATDTKVSIVENPEKNSTNPSKSVLKLDPSNEKNWWARVKIPLKNPLLVTEQNKYLHFLILSPQSPCAFVGYFPSETWINANITRGEWTDVTIDLSAHIGKTIDDVEICPNSLARPNPSCYIDSIEFDGRPSRLADSFLDKINCSLNIKDPDWNFTSYYPEFEVTVQNTSNVSQTFNVICDIFTDTKEHFTKLEKKVTVAAGAKRTESFTFNSAVPNFYRLYVKVSEGANIRTKTYKVFGYKPTEIVTPEDAKPDFQEFWDHTIQTLKNTPPNYKVSLRSSTGNRVIYDVQMTSLDGYIIKGYYSVPKKEGKFPTIIMSIGYSVTAGVPSRTDDFIEFSYNVRGQGISNTKPFGADWIVAGLPEKETYYYRGAYMDALRAVDFVCSRPEVDQDLLFAEGESQGGALSYVIGALDSRVKGVVARVPFLADFEYYYAIKENVSEISLWPMDVLDNYMYNNKVSHEKLFSTLSYFDLKNLTSRIKVPVLMAVGLQDETCPPHINFAAYNQTQGAKEYYIGKEWGHWVDNEFHNRKNAWYAEQIKRITATEEIDEDTQSDIRITQDGTGFVVEGESQDTVTVSVYTTEGTLIYSQLTSLPTEKISCEKGIYIVCVSNNQNCVTKKVVIEK